MNPKKFFFTLLGISLVLLLAVGISFWMANHQLNQKIIKLNKLNTDLILENEQISRLKKLQAQYNDIRPLAEKASAVLPDQKAQDQVVAQVAAIVNKSGLDLSGLTFEKTTGLPDEQSQTTASGIGGIQVMPVRFQTTGNYRQLQAMLLNFEKQQRFMRVNTLDLSRDTEGKITAGVILEVFFKP